MIQQQWMILSLSLAALFYLASIIKARGALIWFSAVLFIPPAILLYMYPSFRYLGIVGVISALFSGYLMNKRQIRAARIISLPMAIAILAMISLFIIGYLDDFYR